MWNSPDGVPIPPLNHYANKIKINFPPPKETLIKPNKIPLDVLYEDNDIIVINKSPGVVIHPGASNYEKTINTLTLNLRHSR